MPMFPRREADRVVLTEAMIAGYAANAGRASPKENFSLPMRTHARDIVKCLILPLKKTRDPGARVNLRRFVIFGQGRCGSTLFTSLLDNHPGINCQGELLQRVRLFPFAHLEWQTTYLENHVLAFGFYLKPWHITRVLHREPGAFIRRLEGAGYKVVYLRRENIFLQSLSQTKLFMYNVVHAKAATAVRKGSVLVDTELLCQLMKNKDRNRQLEEKCLGVLNDPYITVTYESDLLNATSHQETCRRTLDFLGVEQVTVSSPHIKVSPLDWRQGVENAREVEAAVTREGFGSFLETADAGVP